MLPWMGYDTDLFLFSNVSEERTGLPFVVWIRPRGDSRHDVRIKLSPTIASDPHEFTTVAVRPSVHLIEGEMDTSEFHLLKAWIEQNRDTLISYWEGEIDTQDALAALKKI